MSQADQERGEIIRHWRSVELFSPPAVVEKVNRARHVYAVKPGEPLPWDPTHKLARCSPGPHSVWRHVVYLGIYSLASVFDVLSTVFSGDEDSFDERPPGESALAAFAVTAEGRPLIGSEVLSSCAWATGRGTVSGPRLQNVARRFRERLQRVQRDIRRPRRTRSGRAAGGPARAGGAQPRTTYGTAVTRPMPVRGG